MYPRNGESIGILKLLPVKHESGMTVDAYFQIFDFFKWYGELISWKSEEDCAGLHCCLLLSEKQVNIASGDPWGRVWKKKCKGARGQRALTTTKKQPTIPISCSLSYHCCHKLHNAVSNMNNLFPPSSLFSPSKTPSIWKCALFAAPIYSNISQETFHGRKKMSGDEHMRGGSLLLSWPQEIWRLAAELREPLSQNSQRSFTSCSFPASITFLPNWTTLHKCQMHQQCQSSKNKDVHITNCC